MKITDNIHYNNHENMSTKYVSQTIENIMITIHLYNTYNDFLCQKLAAPYCELSIKLKTINLLTLQPMNLITWYKVIYITPPPCAASAMYWLFHRHLSNRCTHL